MSQEQFEIVIFMVIGMGIIVLSQIVNNAIQQAKARAAAAKQAAALANIAAQR